MTNIAAAIGERDGMQCYLTRLETYQVHELMRKFDAEGLGVCLALELTAASQFCCVCCWLRHMRSATPCLVHIFG
jgi:hypothetical protein